MTRDRFKQRFSSQGSDFVVIPPEGSPYRGDGRPLDRYDQAAVEGKDPFEAELGPATEKEAG